jgi:hypothetical protein
MRGPARWGSLLIWTLIPLWGAVARATTLTVSTTSDRGAGSLRDAIGGARDGDVIRFDAGLSQSTITLTGGEITIKASIDIEGPGAAALAVSGNDASRVFNISPGLSVKLAGLTLEHGYVSPGGPAWGGGAVLDQGATLILDDIVFFLNQASNGSSRTVARGGAVCAVNGASLVISNSSFVGNQAFAGDFPGGFAIGGAIFLEQSDASITGSTFDGNRSRGGDGGVANNDKSSRIGVGGAGAIMNNGSLQIQDSLFTNNQAIGGNGGARGTGTLTGNYFIGTGEGGVIDNFGTLIVDGTTFANNQAIGGSHCSGGPGGWGLVGMADAGAIQSLGQATITRSTFDHNLAIAGEGNTSGGGFAFLGFASGGAISAVYVGPVSVVDSTFTDNHAVGGADSVGGVFTGAGIGGAVVGIFGGAASLSGSTFSGNQAVGGAVSATGATGSDGLGGAIASWGGASVTVDDCAIRSNLAQGGAVGGRGLGGGAWNDGPSIEPDIAGQISELTLLASTITHNTASGDGGGVYATAGGNACASDATRLSANSPDNVNTSLAACP